MMTKKHEVEYCTYCRKEIEDDQSLFHVKELPVRLSSSIVKRTVYNRRVKISTNVIEQGSPALLCKQCKKIVDDLLYNEIKMDDHF